MPKISKESNSKSKLGDNPNLNSNEGSDKASASSSIFNTLFRDIAEQGSSHSIFSDRNPFRRKPIDRPQTPQQQQKQRNQQLELGSGSAEADGNTEEVDAKFGRSDGDELKKKNKKRDRDKKGKLDLESPGEAPETPLRSKKLKSVESEIPNMDVASGKRDKGKTRVSDSGSKTLSKKGKEKEQSACEEGKSNPKLDMKPMEVGSDHTLDVENDNVAFGNDRKEKGNDQERKKRKRGEVEAEYEAKRYGLLAEKEGEADGGLGALRIGEKRKKMDNSEDTMVSKEGFDDESKLLRTVFVGNLPLKVKKKVLLREFSKFGEVESVRIRSIPIVDSKIPRKGAIIQKQINDSAGSVHAYVVFKTEESAQASLVHNISVVGGNHIRVDRACPPRKKLKGDEAPLYDKKRTVFVGNLPFDVKDEEIYHLFSSINNLESSVEAIRVIRDPNTSVGKGIAYVLFKTADAVNLVVKKRNLKLRDRELRLSYAKSSSTPSKRKTAPLGESNNSSARKKFSLDSRTPGRKDWVKPKAAISYQGMRASKSGAQKKIHRQTMEPMKSTFKATEPQKQKERTKKRPAVAARKANMLKGGGTSEHAGTKRKPESRTPDSAHRNKRARRFK